MITNNHMMDFIEKILIAVFSVLPSADPSSSVIASVNNAFATINPTFAQLNLIFPIFVLFKILLIVLFIEMTLFLFILIFKVATFFRG